MRLPRNLITLGLGLTLLNAGLATAAEELPAPIRMVQEKGARILGSFDAPDGLRGYAAEYQNQGMALYLTPDGKHVLTGHLFDAQGKDLSREPLERLVYAPLAKEMWQKMEQSAWIADGRADAPRVVYLFSDPNCPYCTMFWEQARPWVDAGKVQLRHIMVGIIREDSEAKSAALLASKDPQKALHDHEQGQHPEAAGEDPGGGAQAARRQHGTDGVDGRRGDPGDLLSQCRGAHAAATGRAAAGPVGGDPRSALILRAGAEPPAIDTPCVTPIQRSKGHGRRIQRGRQRAAAP